jgi:hypothetical protein
VGDEIYAPFHGRDQPHYEGDVAEVFVDPVGDAKQYVEIELTPRNDILDQLLLLTAEPKSDADGVLLPPIWQRNLWMLPEWNLAGLRTAAHIATRPDGKFEWIAEMALPAKSLLVRLGRESFSPMTLRANFLRYEWRKTGLDHVGSPETREFVPLNWAPVRSGCPHLSPQAMGVVRLLPIPSTRSTAAAP